MRYVVGKFLILAGIRILPNGVRDMVRKMLLYNVPGALTEAERAEVRKAKAEWLST